jgi:D-3-phosphoglycerate dehydrogenase / 2-oxoglutarate reductase
MKILVATEKPFAKEAVDQIKSIVDVAGYEFKILEKYDDKAQLLEALSDVDALIIRSDKVTEEVINAAKKLKIVVRAGAGYDNVDLAASTSKNIVVMNTPGQNSNAVAELALGMMIFMARGQFKGKSGSELKGKTLGIHAYGNVGLLVGKIAKGFGMKLSAFDPFIPTEKIEADGVKVYSSVEEFIQIANIFHCIFLLMKRQKIQLITIC